MKLLYVTDLHGQRDKYHRVLELARERGADAVVNGGDLLPHARDLHVAQRQFLDECLDPLLTEYDAAGIRHIAHFGNDDLAVLQPRFDQICRAHPLADNLTGTRIELGDFDLIGMSWVADYPFRLKDFCRLDLPGDAVGRQLGAGLLSRSGGFVQVGNWPAYVAGLPTLAEEVEKLPRPRDPERAIYVMHMPPANLGLDMCDSGQRVGSRAIHRFVEERQPLVTLHGHIHESPDITGVWRARVGRTWCVQPGQTRRLPCVLIDLETLEMQRIQGAG